jgi:hypothetical protein
MFLNVLIPQSDIAVVTSDIYRQADRTYLLQAIAKAGLRVGPKQLLDLST